MIEGLLRNFEPCKNKKLPEKWFVKLQWLFKARENIVG